MATLLAGMRAAALGVLAAALCAALMPAAAQEALPDFYKDPGLYPNRDYVNQHVTENVDPFTGALQIQSVDVHLPGNGGFDLKIIRSYNTTRVNPANPADMAMSSLAGMGWTVHFGRTLRKGNLNACSNSAVNSISDNPVLELPDGSRQVFAYAPFGSAALMITGQRWRAECLGVGTGIAVYSPDGVRYDMTHQVVEVGGAAPLNVWYTTKITDRNGNTADIAYAATLSPQISSVTTSDGRSVTFTYFDPGTSGRRIQTIATGGRTWTYGYQAVAGVTGRYYLTSVTRPDTALTAWGYAYYTTIASDSPRNYQLQRVTYAQGGTLTYDYGFKNFDQTTNPATRSVVVTSKTSSAVSGSPAGSWTFAYTPSAIPGVNDTTVVTTPAGPITYKHVGASTVAIGSVWRIGLLVEKTIGSPVVQTETLTWGSQVISDENNIRVGQFQSLFDSEVRAPILTARTIVRNGVTYTTTFASHDSYGNPQVVTEAGPNGGNRTTNLTYYVNTSLWIVKQVDDETTVGVGTVTRTWDATGNLLIHTRDGVPTTYTRHASGDILTRRDANNNTSTFTNYFRGIPRAEYHPVTLGATCGASGPTCITITRLVSDAGNVTSETNGELQTTGYGYDGLNRLTSVTPPLGNGTTIVYSATAKAATRGALQQVTTLDAFGRAVSVSTAGVVSAYTYDSLGRKIFASIIGYPTVGHAFQYDTLNRVTRITHNADTSYRTFAYGVSGGAPKLDVTDERGHKTTHTYRAYGDPDNAVVMNIAAPVAAASVAILRNGRDQVTQVTQAGIARIFNYNSSYFLSSTVHPEVGTTTYGRDAVGNMKTKKVGASGTTTFDYDGRNRLWRVTYPGGSPSQVTNVYWKTDKLRSVTNAVATRTYGYDNNQNLTSESLVVDGLTLAATYNYNANDQLASIVYPVLGRTVSFDPNVLGRPRQIIVPGGSMLGVVFWPNGQIYDIAFAGGSRVTYGQNTREWLNTVTVKTGDNVNHVASTLIQDVAGNLVRVTDPSFGYNRTLTYDGINRLAVAQGDPWGTGAMSHDAAGNLEHINLNSTFQVNTYDSSPTNRLVRTHFEDSGVIRSETFYSYDAYGNASPTNDPYTYDNASNLVVPGLARSFAYDGANTRVKTVAGPVTTYEFRSAHGLLLAEWRKQSGFYDTLKEHLHLAGKEVAEQQTHFLPGSVLTPSWMFLQPDAIGSPISATWAGGGLLFKENYQPWGTRIDGTAQGYTQRSFAGQFQDRPDLIYMGGRYYNPKIGRFLSIDPREVDPGDLHSLNRYAYANNNPYRYVDPDGNSPLDVAFFVVDAARLGMALYSGGDVKGAAVDLAMSTLGVLSPVPGTGQLLKAVKVADKAVDVVKSADHAADAARGTAAVGFGEQAAKGIPDSALVCRGGACKAENFASGSGVTRASDGTLSGVSTQSRPGASVEELAKPFKNNQVGVTTAGDIRRAGGQVTADGTPKNPNHATVDGLTGQQLERLFSPTRPNPVPPGQRGL